MQVKLAYGLFQTPWASGIDYKLYRAAAEIGAARGWPHLYSAALQRAAIAPLWPRSAWPSWWHRPEQFWTPMVTPPPAAWLAAPLNALSENAGEVVWVTLAAAAYVACVLLIAPAGVGSKLRYAALLCLTWAPALAIVSGNVVLLCALGVIACWRLLATGHPVLAGIALGLASIKPQAMFAVPLLLAATGYRRALAAWAATVAVLALASLLTLGLGGLGDYLALVRFVGGFGQEQSLSLARFFPLPAVDAVLVVLAAALLLLVTLRLRSRGPAIPIALGLLGSLLLSPYLNFEDFVLLIPVALLLVRARLGWAVNVAAVALALTATPAAQGYVWPELLLGGVLLVLLLRSPRGIGERPGAAALGLPSPRAA